MTIRPLSPELAEKARVELNEDPSKIAGDIQHIKDWLAKQPHLRARTDDQWLVAFLRGCKYSLERTKVKLDLYYSIRTTAPELFQVKYNDPLFREILETGAFLILPKSQDPAAPRVTLFRPGRFSDNEKYKMTDVASVMGILQKIMLIDDDNSVVAGTRGLMDLEDMNTSYFLMQMTPTMMKKMTFISQEATPYRMKGFHYINTPSGFETLFNTMKVFLNEKNKQRLHVHNRNYEELYKHIPKNILPAEYGGEAGTIKEITANMIKTIEKYNDWLLEDLQYGTDESKRPGKPKTSEEMFGLDGSFRQLQFD